MAQGSTRAFQGHEPTRSRRRIPWVCTTLAVAAATIGVLSAHPTAPGPTSLPIVHAFLPELEFAPVTAPDLELAGRSEAGSATAVPVDATILAPAASNLRF